MSTILSHLQDGGSLVRGAAAALALLGTGAALGLVANVVLARALGSSGTGIIFVGLTIVSIGATLGRLGLDRVALREAAVLHRDGNAAGLAELRRRGSLTVGAASVVFAIAAWWLTPQLALDVSIRTGLERVLPVLLAGLPASSLLIFQSEFLKSCGHPVLGTFVQATLLPLLFLGGLLALAMAPDATVELVAWMQTGATIAAAATAGYALRNIVPDTGAPSAAPRSIAQLAGAGVPFLFIAGVSLVMSWTDMLVLAAYADSGVVGSYGAASRVASVLAFFLLAAGSVVAPRFAAFAARGELGNLAGAAQSSTKWVTLAALPATLLLLAFPGEILRLFGAEFVQGAGALRILAAGQFVNVASGLVGYLLMMTGHERVLRNLVVVAASLNLLGNLVLVPHFGANGAATATALSLALLNLGGLWQVRRRLGIDTLGYLHRRSVPWNP